uniref:Membrane magnesium transporter n=2 Tax=Noccaea caerulescens TaxID=107243 RepID=A0A1J3JXX4_NOCCA
MNFGFVMGVSGIMILSHAAYSTIQYRGVLKIMEEEFYGPPMNVVLELILGLAACMWAALTLPRNFSSIHPVTDQNSSMYWEPELELESESESEAEAEVDSELISLLNQIIFLVISMDSECELRSLLTRMDFLVRSMDSESELRSLFSQIIRLVISSNSEAESEIILLATQMISLVTSMDSESEFRALITQIASLINSMDSECKLRSLIAQITDLDSEPESELVLLITQITPLVSSMDSEPKPKSELVLLLNQIIFIVVSMDPGCELVSLLNHMISLIGSMDSESELRSLITEMISLAKSINSDPEAESGIISLASQIFSLVSSMDSESEFKSVVTQIASLVSSMDSESELRSLITRVTSLVGFMDSDSRPDPYPRFISLCPQMEVEFVEERYRVKEKIQRYNDQKRCELSYEDWELFRTREDVTHFRCVSCNGEDHEEYEKAPLEVKHPLHPKHSLELVLLRDEEKARKCYCCDRYFGRVFYYCTQEDCDYAMDIACVEKSPLLTVEHPKRHEHTLALFPRQTPLTCNVCALADSKCPIYICPPCDFVVHQSCIGLPRVIKISRHLHRISFTSSFGQGHNWSCNVCRRKINNDYGGYSCIKDGCSYAAHSRCATQSNVWDGKELEGVPEDIEQVLDPFVEISDGVIEHFLHEHHHLRIDEDTNRDYDENKLCQACVMPIYCGNFYSCMKCDFILHQTCANLARKIDHPSHAHPLTLVSEHGEIIGTGVSCTACPWLCTGFFYRCGNGRCHFKVHVQCATISEPLVHKSHMHPLFLTSKPGQRRTCDVCKDAGHNYMETFNCIECDFALCYKCATLPENVRYKHDDHMLTLSYGKETSTKTYWCEACEGTINQKERFYICDEYCCVTLHIECLIGGDFYMKPGSSLSHFCVKVDILPNNGMSRPLCTACGKRCQYKVVSQCFGSIFCSPPCVSSRVFRSRK